MQLLCFSINGHNSPKSTKSKYIPLSNLSALFAYHFKPSSDSLYLTQLPLLSSPSYFLPSFAHLCWKKFSRALQMVYLSWMVSRCSSCCPKVRPWTRILGGRISATHCRELSIGERARSTGTPLTARSCSARVKVGGPSSTTRVGMAPLPWSMDTTFSWEEVLQADT